MLKIKWANCACCFQFNAISVQGNSVEVKEGALFSYIIALSSKEKKCRTISVENGEMLCLNEFNF